MKAPPLTVTGRLRWEVLHRWLEEIEPVERVLEIGAGVGGFGARLAAAYRYVGLEPDAESARLARHRIVSSGGEFLQGTIEDLPQDTRFDLVGAFEVLEHLEDDLGALRRWRDRLEPGGWIVLSVPAFRRRYGPWDEWAGHYRRYEREEIESVLRRAGFEVRFLRAYGWPLANLTEWIRHRMAARTPIEGKFAERTARSGRVWEFGELADRLVDTRIRPFLWLQRRAGSDRGVGIFVAAIRKEG